MNLGNLAQLIGVIVISNGVVAHQVVEADLIGLGLIGLGSLLFSVGGKE